jgi:hypothetical protein
MKHLHPTPGTETETGCTDWAGGECPVDHYSFAEVRFRDGGTAIAPAFHWVDRWSNRWAHTGPFRSEDIVAYREVRA